MNLIYINRFVCLGQNSLSGHCQLQVSSRSTVALPYMWSIWAFLWESPWKILYITKCHSSWSKAHSIHWVSSQKNECRLYKSSWPFTMDSCGSQHDHVIHVVLITTPHVTLVGTLMWDAMWQPVRQLACLFPNPQLVWLFHCFWLSPAETDYYMKILR